MTKLTGFHKPLDAQMENRVGTNDRAQQNESSLHYYRNTASWRISRIRLIFASTTVENTGTVPFHIQSSASSVLAETAPRFRQPVPGSRRQPIADRGGAMLLNQDTILIGDRVRLVPYKVEHVQQYHEWMQDPEILELTASEPLTLEQEYAMQTEWRQDPNKCTFIVVDKLTDTPVGDINLFLEFHEPGEAEIDVMIADKRFRRKGLAWSAVQTMMQYAKEVLGLRVLIAKISAENAPSQALFKRAGFEVTDFTECFHEFSFSKSI
uniref:N-acetyltransferase domain-containing protein n=1 Tax=Spongospora subterranea TaxID=70186 RepID=A0A0H5RBT2_9EUKA|eukprot:CRZ11236.1 hypothetical protein [Spongospora subterranea]